MKKTLMAGALTLALTGPAFAFGDSGLWGDSSVYEPSYGAGSDYSSYGTSQYHTDRQDAFTRQFLEDFRAQNPIEPGGIPYPCGFNNRNARAKASCQRDWQAHNPNDYLNYRR